MKCLHSANLGPLCGLLLISTLGFAKSPQGSFQKSFSVNGPVDLEVFTHSGDITVRHGATGIVSVSGKIYLSTGWLSGTRNDAVIELEKNPPIQQSGNRVHIDYVAASNISIDYEITVPPDTMLRTHSGSGDQVIEGIGKKLELESGSGDMRLRDISGDVHTRSGSGDVEARGIAGPVHAETGSGDIRLDESGSGDVRLQTGSGDIEVHGANGSVNAETGSGYIMIAGNITSSWNIRTGSGDVRLDLPPQSAFDLDASTGSGDLSVNHPVATTVQGNLDRRHHAINGKVGAGGPSLAVHSASGNVHIH
jgi:hypothetical protein